MADYRILVTGSRTWTDVNAVCMALSEIADEVGVSRMVVVHGAASRGADRIADMWACRNATVERHPADWSRHGKAAGLKRNAEMVALGADVCLAFIDECRDPECRCQQPHGSHGAGHCAALAKKAGIPVRRYTGEKDGDDDE